MADNKPDRPGTEAPKHIWVMVRDFEKLLADNDTIILKFFLHISKKEQEERLLAREKRLMRAAVSKRPS